MQSSRAPRVIRIVHCVGGILVNCDPVGTCKILPPNKDMVQEFQLKQFDQLFQVVKNFNLEIVGCEFLYTQNHLTGTYSPDWRCFYPKKETMNWPQQDITDIWSNISHNAARENKMGLFERSRNIASHLRLAAWRLLDLSQRYHHHLSVLTKTQKHSDGHSSQGQYTDPIYAAVHAMFADLASLRDHLAISIVRDVLQSDKHKIDSMGHLKSSPEIFRDNAEIQELIETSSSWLTEFGAYRNLITHTLPLTNAPGANGIAQINFNLSWLTVNAVSLRLPKEPLEIKARQKSGHSFEDYDEWIEYITSKNREGPDALSYCHKVFGEILTLANTVANNIDANREMLRFDADQIKGIKIKYEKGI